MCFSSLRVDDRNDDGTKKIQFSDTRGEIGTPLQWSRKGEGSGRQWNTCAAVASVSLTARMSKFVVVVVVLFHSHSAPTAEKTQTLAEVTLCCCCCRRRGTGHDDAPPLATLAEAQEQEKAAAASKQAGRWLKCVCARCSLRLFSLPARESTAALVR